MSNLNLEREYINHWIEANGQAKYDELVRQAQEVAEREVIRSFDRGGLRDAKREAVEAEIAEIRANGSEQELMQALSRARQIGVDFNEKKPSLTKELAKARTEAELIVRKQLAKSMGTDMTEQRLRREFDAEVRQHTGNSFMVSKIVSKYRNLGLIDTSPMSQAERNEGIDREVKSAGYGPPRIDP